MTTKEPRPARLLHISDLHFGSQFQWSKWELLKQTAKGLDPDLVVVTGDVVNTPWRWMLKRARAQLEALATELGRR